VKPLLALLASAICALGANPYLHLPNDKPVTREFVETQWDAKGRKSEPAKALVTIRRSYALYGTMGDEIEITVDSRSLGTFKLFFTNSGFTKSGIMMDNEASIRMIDKLVCLLRPVLNHPGLYLGGQSWVIHNKRKILGPSSVDVWGDKLYQFQKGVGLVGFGHKKSGKYPACSWVLKEQATTKTNHLWHHLLGEAVTKTVPVKSAPNGRRHEAYRPLSQ
jgi:hypothetical protein